MLTGHQAWQAAGTAPQRFIPAPRQSPEQRLTVADTDVDTLDLVAATLRRVAGEAQRVVGSAVEDVRLVVPAGWGPRRPTWMRHAANKAGLPQPRLIEAPVAVAGHFLAAGVQLPVGSYVVVCDVGAGAEVSVLRRGPAGFEVVATLADPTAGGTAIDEALVATLADGGPAGGNGQRWALLALSLSRKHLADPDVLRKALADAGVRAKITTDGTMCNSSRPRATWKGSSPRRSTSPTAPSS